VLKAILGQKLSLLQLILDIVAERWLTKSYIHGDAIA